MKPRTKAWLFVVLLGLAVGSLGVCARSQLWILVAYEEKPLRSRKDQPGLAVGMVYLEKRAEWLPGGRFIFPHQSCGPCNGQLHAICEGAYESVVRPHGTAVSFHFDEEARELQWTTHNSRYSGYRDALPPIRCTCTDVSHRDR